MELKKILTAVFLCTICCVCIPAKAQKREKALDFDALTINDGLSQGMVVKILQDKFGFMWFATLDGLNRYDGYKFTVFRHDQQDSTSVTKSYAQSLFEDSEGRLWIGTVSGGLDLFDRETETFIHVTGDGRNGARLAEGPVKSIAEDAHGNIWVHIGDQLEKINIQKNEKRFPGRLSLQHIKMPFRSDVSLFSITGSGKIYYVNSGEGIMYRLDDEKGEKWTAVLTLSDTLPHRNSAGIVTYKIVQLVEDTLTAKIYVLHYEGVTCINDNTGKPEAVFQNDFFRNFDAPLRAVLDKSGMIWFSGINNLFLYDTRKVELMPATSPDINYSRLVRSAYSVFIDRSGLLWIGTSGYGLLKRNTRSEFFHHVVSGADYSITEDDKGNILFGNGKVVRQIFDRKTAQLKNVPGNNKDEQKYLDHFLFLPVAADKDGEWFTGGSMLRYQNKTSKQTVDYPLPVSFNNEYQELVQSKLKDSAGHIWIGTTSGLLRFGLADKKWTVFKNKPTDHTSISNDVIFSLCPDPIRPAKYLWIGTGGGGLNRMDLNTGRCKSYSLKDGLPNNVIYGILSDDAGNLWMSTNKGLSCFNLKTETFKNFDHNDGLQSNEFNRGAYYKSKDGRLYFGGVNGFNYFYPKAILNNMTVPQVVITGVKIRNQPVPVQEEGSPLIKAPYLTQKITLPYEQNFVSFQFAALDFTAPEKNMYRYRLIGFDENLIYSGTANTATYSNLDPGTYTFHVEGSNNDGTWNVQGASMQVIILPPWYMTWWFRSLLVLAVLFALYTFYKYRLAQALKVQAIRNRIADDLHDEVGSNLSNIYIFSNVAQQKASADTETGPLLQKISDYTRQSMEAISDIVWMINTRNDRFENIMVRMRTLAAEIAETADCSLHLDFDEKLDAVKLNMEQRKNFYLIYKEAINNTAKYAGCRTLSVQMKLTGRLVTLNIHDDGKGFDLAAAKPGNGLFTMKKRAALLQGELTVTSAAGGGTAVLLHFRV